MKGLALLLSIATATSFAKAAQPYTIVGTVTDRAPGLMWSKADSGVGMNWQAALAWVQKNKAEKFLGHPRLAVAERQGTPEHR